MPTAHREVETKFDVEETWSLPDLSDLPGVVDISVAEHTLRAEYLDTPDLRLLSRGLTLRRRLGGPDAGWHLKRPAGDAARDELRLPLGRSGRRVPRALTQQVAGYVRGAPLGEVARLTTHRVTHRLLDATGAVLAEVADDGVVGERPGGADSSADGDGGPAEGAVTVQRWREIEVELVTGGRRLLDAVGQRLCAAGARPAAAPSKLARLVPLPTAAKPNGAPGASVSRSSTAGDVVREHLAGQVAEIQRRDPQVRDDAEDAVHKMRVAARRLRSALATYRPLLDREVTEPIRAELKWLGTVLSEQRDTEVLHARLRALLAAEPGELVLGPVAARVDEELTRRYLAARRRTVAELGSRRYFDLLDRLDRLVERPPLTRLAGEPAETVLPRRVRASWRRVRRLAAAAEADPGRLHEVRKAAKRARYAAESVAHVFGAPAGAFAAEMETVQETLGAHQDSVVSRDWLRQQAVRAYAAGENAFSYGRLHALEGCRGERAVVEYRQHWERLSGPRTGRW